MTSLDREKIFSKEVITVKDIGALYKVGIDKARQIMRELKHESDRFKLKGRIHIEDYRIAIKEKLKKSNEYRGIANEHN